MHINIFCSKCFLSLFMLGIILFWYPFLSVQYKGKFILKLQKIECIIVSLKIIINSNMASFFRFVDKRAMYRWYNPIRTCAGECGWLFHWQHKLCATFSANVNINYRLPIKVYYRICTLRHTRIEINHGSQNVFWVLTWVGGY